MNEYVYILEYLFITVFFATAIVLISTIVFQKKKIYKNKLSAYECGFTAFSNAREELHINYFVTGILFIIFDVELVLLIPWAIGINYVPNAGHFVVCIFYILLFIGFFFEWIRGALDW